MNMVWGFQWSALVWDIFPSDSAQKVDLECFRDVQLLGADWWRQCVWEGDGENPPDVQQQCCGVSIRTPLQQALVNPINTNLASFTEHTLFINIDHSFTYQQSYVTWCLLYNSVFLKYIFHLVCWITHAFLPEPCEWIWAWLSLQHHSVGCTVIKASQPAKQHISIRIQHIYTFPFIIFNPGTPPAGWTEYCRC